MKITLFGATGQTGQLVLHRALAAGHEVTALARRPEAIVMQHSKLHVVKGDALNAADVERAIAGQEGVISTIGARTLKPDTICADSARLIIAAMQATGARRYITISGAGLGDNAGVIIERIVRPTLLKNVYADALAQDTLVQASDLDWTIVRPYRLTNGAGTNYVVSAQKFPSPLIIRSTSRADVATCMVRELNDTGYVRKIVFISSWAI